MHMKPTFSIRIVIVDSWLSVKANLKFFVLLTLLLWGIQAIRQFVLGALPNPSLVYSLTVLLFMLLNTAVTLGLIHLSLNFLKTKQTAFSDLTARLSLFWPYLLSSIYYGLIVLAGTILLIIPGVIWAIRYQFFGYLIVDRGLKPKDALAKSKEITQGNWGKLFLFGLSLMLLNLVGLLAFLVGLLVTIPMSLLATAKVYQLLSGANPTPPRPVVPASSPPAAPPPTNVWKTNRPA